jgi:hypothetical protein
MVSFFRAMLLAVLAVTLFAAHGQAVVQCLCSGRVFLGPLPEICCGGCESVETHENSHPSSDPLASPAPEETDAGDCSGICFEVTAEEWDKAVPLTAKWVPETHLLDIAAWRPDFVVPVLSESRWREARGGAPPTPRLPGPTLPLLYGALLL